MAQAAPQYQPATKPVSPGLGAVAAGGPIAELQRTIEERMTVTEWHATTHQGGGAIHRLSRVAGPALLAMAYAAVAIWWF